MCLVEKWNIKYIQLKENFVFIQTQEMEEERSSMGWGDIDLPTYVKKSYSNAFAEIECRRIIDQADVVIIGSAPNHFVKNRITMKSCV